jgi:Tol biopolymer transport system component
MEPAMRNRRPARLSRGQRFPQRLVILGTSALVLVACSSSDGGNTNTTAPSDADMIATGPTSSSAELGRIIFVRESLDGSGLHVFSIDPDGTGEIQLIAPAAETPLLSPDGSRLAFECLDGDRVRVCMADADGSDPTMLTPDMSDMARPIDNYAPRAWSPDSEQLVLIGFGGAPAGIFTMPASDGGELVRITTSPVRHMDDTLALSPDGSRIVFLRTPIADDHDADVYVVATDGMSLVRLSPPGMAVECCVAPAWSPDGSRIVFAGKDATDDWAVYSVDADGSDRERISPLDGWAFAPRWSPDGRTIAFTQSASNGAQIFLVHPDGTDLVQVTDRWDSLGQYNAVWSPDGSQLVFQHGDGGQVSDLWVIDTDGKGLLQLTDTPETEDSPSWLWATE